MPRSARETRSSASFLQKLIATDDTLIPFDRKLRQIEALRRESPELVAEVLPGLLEENQRLKKGLEQAGAAQEELKATQGELAEALKALTAPPWHPATFLEFTHVDGEERALVSHNGSVRFVSLGDDCNRDELDTGDQVLLSGDLNILVGRIDCLPLDCGETALFERYEPDGRLVLSRRDEEVVTIASGRLKRTELSRGDEVRWSQKTWVAFEKIQRSRGDHFFLEEAPKGNFDDIGGLDDAINEIKQLVLLHYQHPELAAKYHMPPRRSILLAGYPGTGKTMIVRGLVNWLNTLSKSGRARFINVKPGELGSMWFAETERNIRGVFRAARQAAKEQPGLPVVIFFDEVDGIAGARGHSINSIDDRVVTALAAEIEGLEERGDILVVSATNRRDMMDTALIRSGRLSDLPIRVPRPNRAAGRKVLEKYLRDDVPYADGCDRDTVIDSIVARFYSANGESDIASIKFRDGANRTVKMKDIASGAMLAKVAHETTRAACTRDAETGEGGVCLADALRAVDAEMEEASSMLTAGNCRRHLDDLPQDVEIVSVHPARKAAARRHDYIHVA
jgi:proteasome-associated ATPase